MVYIPGKAILLLIYSGTMVKTVISFWDSGRRSGQEAYHQPRIPEGPQIR